MITANHAVLKYFKPVSTPVFKFYYPLYTYIYLIQLLYSYLFTAFLSSFSNYCTQCLQGYAVKYIQNTLLHLYLSAISTLPALTSKARSSLCTIPYIPLIPSFCTSIFTTYKKSEFKNSQQIEGNAENLRSKNHEILSQRPEPNTTGLEKLIDQIL